jgi:trk system potassium uptake protein TrkH
MLIGYLSYGLIGWVLLSLPFAWEDGPVAPIDNLFVAMSAMSTTGLITVNTPLVYSFFGELVVMGLFQLGGIGYMTLGSFVILAGRRRVSRFREGMTRSTFVLPEGFDVGKFIRNVVLFTLVVEAVGAVALFFAFRAAGVAELGAGGEVGASGDGLLYVAWTALFHSVSAFCTAGFSVFPDSLEGYRANVWVNLIISALSVSGAIGFLVLSDFFGMATGAKRRITLTSKIILHFTFWTLVIGTLTLLITDASLAELPQSERLLAAWFQAMTAMTTVGFNTHPIGALAWSSVLLMFLLMLIGASPSGTGGGLKTTSVSALWATMRSVLRGRSEVTFWGAVVPKNRLHTAFAALGFYVLTAFLGGMLILLTEANNAALAFEDLLFEVLSALGTVGLSRGLTGDLSSLGKLVIIVLMFAGRMGPLTLGLALFGREDPLGEAAEEGDVAI